MTQSTGSLFVVATPIGNLADITQRARDVLGQVDLVAAEDTRRAGQLLTRLGLKRRLVSVHEHNESDRVAGLIEALEQGQDIALVSDAGTPLISDPGYRLVAAARARSLPVVPVPGACAAIAALSVAGLPSDRFRFEGFLPSREGPCRRRLQALADAPETLVFYEAVHRIDATLSAMAGVFGADRPAVLCRELTKRHETVYCGTLQSLREQLAADEDGGHRGEFTLVVGGCTVGQDVNPGELERVYRLLAAELPPGRAAALAARITGARRADAYRLAHLPESD